MITINTIQGRVSSNDVATIRITSTAIESQKGNVIGRALIGGALLGGVGALAGGASAPNKNKTKVSFEATLKDGRIVTGVASLKAIERFARAVQNASEPVSYARLYWFAAIVAALFIVAHV